MKKIGTRYRTLSRHEPNGIYFWVVSALLVATVLTIYSYDLDRVLFSHAVQEARQSPQGKSSPPLALDAVRLLLSILTAIGSLGTFLGLWFIASTHRKEHQAGTTEAVQAFFSEYKELWDFDLKEEQMDSKLIEPSDYNDWLGNLLMSAYYAHSEPPVPNELRRQRELRHYSNLYEALARMSLMPMPDSIRLDCEAWLVSYLFALSGEPIFLDVHHVYASYYPSFAMKVDTIIEVRNQAIDWFATVPKERIPESLLFDYKHIKRSLEYSVSGRDKLRREEQLIVEDTCNTCRVLGSRALVVIGNVLYSTGFDVESVSLSEAGAYPARLQQFNYMTSADTKRFSMHHPDYAYSRRNPKFHR